MQLQLIPFPGTSGTPVQSLTVDVDREAPNLLKLVYTLKGDIARLRIPAPAAPVPTEKLWEHTCFELFFRTSGEEAYHEYNFAPSLAWDHYFFSAYRKRVEGAPKATPLIQLIQKTADTLQVQVHVQIPTVLPLDIAPTTVIEDTNGALSYWAIQHVDKEPNFHHADNFTAKV